MNDTKWTFSNGKIYAYAYSDTYSKYYQLGQSRIAEQVEELHDDTSTGFIVSNVAKIFDDDFVTYFLMNDGSLFYCGGTDESQTTNGRILKITNGPVKSVSNKFILFENNQIYKRSNNSPFNFSALQLPVEIDISQGIFDISSVTYNGDDFLYILTNDSKLYLVSIKDNQVMNVNLSQWTSDPIQQIQAVSISSCPIVIVRTVTNKIQQYNKASKMYLYKASSQGSASGTQLTSFWTENDRILKNGSIVSSVYYPYVITYANSTMIGYYSANDPTYITSRLKESQKNYLRYHQVNSYSVNITKDVNCNLQINNQLTTLQSQTLTLYEYQGVNFKFYQNQGYQIKSIGSNIYFDYTNYQAYNNNMFEYYYSISNIANDWTLNFLTEKITLDILEPSIGQQSIISVPIKWTSNQNLKNYQLYENTNLLGEGTDFFNYLYKNDTVLPYSSSYTLLLQDTINNIQKTISFTTIQEPSVVITSPLQNSKNISLNPTITWQNNGLDGISGLKYKITINGENIVTDLPITQSSYTFSAFEKLEPSSFYSLKVMQYVDGQPDNIQESFPIFFYTIPIKMTGEIQLITPDDNYIQSPSEVLCQWIPIISPSPKYYEIHIKNNENDNFYKLDSTNLNYFIIKNLKRHDKIWWKIKQFSDNPDEEPIESQERFFELNEQLFFGHIYLYDPIYEYERENTSVQYKWKSNLGFNKNTLEYDVFPIIYEVYVKRNSDQDYILQNGFISRTKNNKLEQVFTLNPEIIYTNNENLSWYVLQRQTIDGEIFEYKSNVMMFTTKPHSISGQISQIYPENFQNGISNNVNISWSHITNPDVTKNEVKYEIYSDNETNYLTKVGETKYTKIPYMLPDNNFILTNSQNKQEIHWKIKQMDSYFNTIESELFTFYTLQNKMSQLNFTFHNIEKSHTIDLKNYMLNSNDIQQVQDEILKFEIVSGNGQISENGIFTYDTTQNSNNELITFVLKNNDNDSSQQYTINIKIQKMINIENEFLINSWSTESINIFLYDYLQNNEELINNILFFELVSSSDNIKQVLITNGYLYIYKEDLIEGINNFVVRYTDKIKDSDMTDYIYNNISFTINNQNPYPQPDISSIPDDFEITQTNELFIDLSKYTE